MKPLNVVVLAAAGLLLTGLTAFAQGGPTAGACATCTATAPTALTTAEADALIYMCEEEKLAHDVYLALYEQWGLAIFDNIAASEQTHTDAVAGLLDRYGLADPAAGNVAGAFSNTELQALYDRLVAQGGQALADALEVGAAIEEIDIIDLQERQSATAQADILRVFANLEQASGNHLRSFVSTLSTQASETYAPQYLDDAEYAALAGAVPARGRH
jgi:hypothetical protein